MRKLLSISLILSSACFGQAVFRGQNGSTSSCLITAGPHDKQSLGLNGGTTSFTLDTTNVKLIVVFISSFDGTSATLTDLASNSYTGLTNQSNTGNNQGRLYYVVNPTNNASMTWTYANTAVVAAIFVQTFYCAGAFDQQNGTAGNGTSHNAGSVTPGFNNEVIVTGFSNGTSTAAGSVTGFSTPDSVPIGGGSNYGGSFCYKIQTTAAAIDPPWVWSGTVDYVLATGTFQVAP